MIMSKIAVVFSCAHADPTTSNERFDWLGELIYDVNPNYIIDLGDGADMRSLNSFDTRSPEAIVSQSYEQDIEHYNESMDRLRQKPSQRKYKRPRWIGFEGNHENLRNVLFVGCHVLEFTEEDFQMELAKPHNAPFAAALREAEGR